MAKGSASNKVASNKQTTFWIVNMIYLSHVSRSHVFSVRISSRAVDSLTSSAVDLSS